MHESKSDVDGERSEMKALQSSRMHESKWCRVSTAIANYCCNPRACMNRNPYHGGLVLVNHVTILAHTWIKKEVERKKRQRKNCCNLRACMNQNTGVAVMLHNGRVAIFAHAWIKICPCHHNTTQYRCNLRACMNQNKGGSAPWNPWFVAILAHTWIKIILCTGKTRSSKSRNPRTCMN